MMNLLRPFFFLLLLNLFGLTGFSQTYADKSYYLVDSLNLDELSKDDRQLLDSAMTIYHNAKHDTDKINSLWIIGRNMVNENWKKYNRHIKDLVNYKLSKNPKKGLKKYYLKSLSDAINNMGYINTEKGDFLMALDCYEKSLVIKQALNYKQGIASTYINIGVIYDNQGMILKALDYYFKGLKTYEELKDQKGIAISLNNIGYIYAGQRDNENGIKFFNKSLKIKEKMDDQSGIATTLNNIGLIYYNSKDFFNAIKYYSKSLEIRKKIGDQKGEANSHINIGLVYYAQKNYNKSLNEYEIALKGLEAINNKMGIVDASTNLGFVYFDKGDNSKAKVLGSKSLNYANELGSPKNIKEAAKLLSKVYKKEGHFKKGWEMYELYITMLDSIRNNEIKSDLLRQETKYQIEKKEQEIKLQQKNIEVLQKDKKIKNYTLYGFVVFFITIMLLLYGWFRGYKLKQNIKENEIRYQLDLYLKQIEILKGSKQSDALKTISDLNAVLSNPLSEREQEVLEELSKGKTNKEIAETLFVSINTVKTHLLSIYEKLDVNNRTQAVKKIDGIERS